MKIIIKTDPVELGKSAGKAAGDLIMATIEEKEMQTFSWPRAQPV